ncbi:MAG TPA: hypothetical protein VL359_19200 [bacterium]|nr:hypothetical protein [bacterium]
MRTPIAFDTHAYVKKLVAAGMPEAQAEVQAEALGDLALTHLATKQDLSDLEQRMDTRFKEAALQTDARLKELELRLTLRLGAMPAAAVAIVVALIKLL